MEYFFKSNSKVEKKQPILANCPNALSHLSTMTYCAVPLELDGHKFHSIENAFSYEKCTPTGKDPSPLMLSGELAYNPFQAKAYAGKSQNPMTPEQIEVWNSRSLDVMRSLVKQRIKTDPLFRNIIEDARAKKVTLRHFALGTPKNPPIWGCFRLKKTGELIGQDLYGNLLRTIETS